MTQPVFNELLARRRDRMLAILLSLKERELDQYLPPEASAKFRKAVLDQVNEFHDLCLDLIRSVDNGSVIVNELYLEEKFAQLQEVVLNGRA